MNLFLSLILAIYIVLVVYKAATILEHLIWINRNGLDYRKHLDKLRKKSNGAASANDVWIMLNKRRFKNPHLPAMGFKEFRVRAAVHRYRHRSGVKNKLVLFSLRLSLILYDFVTVGLLGGLLLTSCGLGLRANSSFSETLRTLGILASVCLIATLLCLTVEPTIVYARLGSYATAFQNPLAYVNRALPGTFVSELATLVGLALAILYVDTGILSFLVNAGFDSFNVDQLAGFDGLFHCAYSVFMTFVLSSPLEPKSNLGQATQIAFTAQGVFILTVALVGLAAIVKFAPAENNH